MGVLLQDFSSPSTPSLCTPIDFTYHQSSGRHLSTATANPPCSRESQNCLSMDGEGSVLRPTRFKSHMNPSLTNCSLKMLLNLQKPKSPAVEWEL